MFSTGQRGLLACLGTALLLGAGSCTAILDFSAPISERNDIDGGADAGGGMSIDAMPQADASPAICLTNEPNDTTADAAFITPQEFSSATCSATDVDIYTFDLADGQDLSITLEFTGDAGDNLDLRLLDAGGGVLGISNGITNTEQITRTVNMRNVLPQGTYHIEVQPKAVTSLILYTMTLSVMPAVPVPVP